MHIVLAALLHDVGTPPFAHTAEYVLDGFDHEIEARDSYAHAVVMTFPRHAYICIATPTV